MNKWSLVLHIYQPPNQRADIIDLVGRESYDPLLDFLASVDAPVTLNVTGCLTQQLAQHARTETLERLRRVAEKPSITITTTAFTHALLPLWSDEIVTDQIEQNNEVQAQLLSDHWHPEGAWLPECAYQARLEPLLKKAGVKWTVVDESSLRSTQYSPAVRSEVGGLRLAVRHRALSQALATDVDQFTEVLNGIDGNAVVALDGEVFGHFDQRSLDRLRLVFERFGDRLQSISQLVSGKLPRASLRPSTWETESWDRLRQQPYPLWQDRRNNVNRAMWHLYHRVWSKIDQNDSYRTEPWVKHHFTNAISSCWFWWANPKRTAGPFKMSIWNPDMIVEGTTELIKAARSDPKLSSRAKWQLETEYADLLKLVWRTHWKMRS